MTKRFGRVVDNFGALPEQEQPGSAHAPAARRVGRPPGKKNNPEYKQVTVYLREEAHRAAKKVLLDEQCDFSELVDELLEQWLRTSGRSKV